MNRSVTVTALLVVAVLASTAAQPTHPGVEAPGYRVGRPFRAGGGFRQTPRAQAGERVISPTVVATWMSHQDEKGTHELDLLVLWRGGPGWFRQDGRGGGSMSAGGAQTPGGGQIRTTRLHYGGLTLDLVFDPRARTAHIGGRRIELGEANVILVDAVDARGGLQVAGTRRVEPSMPDNAPRIEMVLRRSTELMDYLQCDVRLPDPKAQLQMDFICAQVLGRCDARLEHPQLQAMLAASCKQAP